MIDYYHRKWMNKWWSFFFFFEQKKNFSKLKTCQTRPMGYMLCLTKAWRQTELCCSDAMWTLSVISEEDDHYIATVNRMNGKCLTKEKKEPRFTIRIQQICCAYKRAQFASLISLFACNVVNWFDEWFQ